MYDLAIQSSTDTISEFKNLLETDSASENNNHEISFPHGNHIENNHKNLDDTHNAPIAVNFDEDNEIERDKSACHIDDDSNTNIERIPAE